MSHYRISENFKNYIFSRKGSLRLAKRFVRKCPQEKIYVDRLAHELSLINKKGFVDHFLLARDVLDLATDVPHITRGSCGSSLVCYLLGISNIDPVKENISFARFLNHYRSTPPDIDFDFSHKKRDIIFQRVHDKWGDKVARISNHVYYKEKSALRQAIKDNGITKFVPKSKCKPERFPKQKDDIVKRRDELMDTFRHYSLHCGGIIFYKDDVPEDIILNKEKKGKQAERPGAKIKQIKYNKDDVEDNGKLKIDILSNRGLSQLFDISKMQLEDYPQNDKLTEELLANANCIGLTFAESPIMIKTMISIKPKTMKDLATCLAIIRPAAASGGRKTFYLKNAAKGMYSDYIIYDDDAINYIRKLVDCDEATADKYRRSFAKRKMKDMMYFDCIINDMVEYDSIIDNLNQLRKYSFCKSHAFSYAQLVWGLAYQKAHNPKKFWRSTLNNCNSMYRKWVHFSEAKTSGLKLTLGCKPWIIKNGELVGKGVDKYRKNIYDPNSPIDQYLTYGYWTSKKFLPGMYLKILDERKKLVEFRGLIATGRPYRGNYNKFKNNTRSRIKGRDTEGCTFITIGYKTGYFIDLTIYGLHKIGWCDIVKGKGYLKQYIQDVEYLTIDVTEHRFEKLKINKGQ